MLRCVYVARLICSDESCATHARGDAQTLEELDTLVCDCGCALAIIGWPDHLDDPAARGVLMQIGSAAESSHPPHNAAWVASEVPGKLVGT
jgi:hypothetical protein